MIYRATRLLVFLLHLCVYRPACVSCTPPDLVIQNVVDNLRLLIGHAGWPDIINVAAEFETRPGEMFTYSAQSLYKDEITVDNVDAKHFMVTTLLGCEYMDALFKYTRLIMIGLVQCQHLRARMSDSANPNYQQYLHCYESTSKNMVSSLEMFDHMISALDWLKIMYPTHRAYVGEFIHRVNLLRSHSQNEFLLQSQANANVYSVMINQQCVMSSLNMNHTHVKEFVKKRNCILLDDNEQYPNIPPDEVLTYVSDHIAKLRSTVITNYYDKLGFSVRLNLTMGF